MLCLEAHNLNSTISSILILHGCLECRGSHARGLAQLQNVSLQQADAVRSLVPDAASAFCSLPWKPCVICSEMCMSTSLHFRCFFFEFAVPRAMREQALSKAVHITLTCRAS